MSSIIDFAGLFAWLRGFAPGPTHPCTYELTSCGPVFRQHPVQVQEPRKGCQSTS